MRHPVLKVFLLCILAYSAVSYWETQTYGMTDAGEKVKLSDVRVLNLNEGRNTTGRRYFPVPQLMCCGGTAGCKDKPTVVRCYNIGSDGRDVQWKCRAQMKRSQTFAFTLVSCEGYSHAQDDYVLVGSCALEYYLDRKGSPTPGPITRCTPRAFRRSAITLPPFLSFIYFLLAAIGAFIVCVICYFVVCGEESANGPGRRHAQGDAPDRNRPPDRPIQPVVTAHGDSDSPDPTTNYGWPPTIRRRHSWAGRGTWTEDALGHRDGSRGRMRITRFPF